MCILLIHNRASATSDGAAIASGGGEKYIVSIRAVLGGSTGVIVACYEAWFTKQAGRSKARRDVAQR